MADLKKVQKTHGGYRPNSGPKKGSTQKLRVTDFFNGDERDQLIMEAKEKAFVDKDQKMIMFLFEQLFGKATQKVAGDDEGDPLRIIEILKNEG